jgi:hypothetical protein
MDSFLLSMLHVAVFNHSINFNDSNFEANVDTSINEVVVVVCSTFLVLINFDNDDV